MSTLLTINKENKWRKIKPWLSKEVTKNSMKIRNNLNIWQLVIQILFSTEKIKELVTRTKYTYRPNLYNNSKYNSKGIWSEINKTKNCDVEVYSCCYSAN